MNHPLIFDTSVWVDHIHRKNSPQTHLLKYYLENELETPLVPTIAQEILQGMKEDSQHTKYKNMLRRHTWLELPHMRASTDAAALFRMLRRKGVTIRKSPDCIIAVYAIAFDLELVHNDSDFDLISPHTALRVWKVKPWKNNKG